MNKKNLLSQYCEKKMLEGYEVSNDPFKVPIVVVSPYPIFLSEIDDVVPNNGGAYV